MRVTPSLPSPSWGMRGESVLWFTPPQHARHTWMTGLPQLPWGIAVEEAQRRMGVGGRRAALGRGSSCSRTFVCPFLSVRCASMGTWISIRRTVGPFRSVATRCSRSGHYVGRIVHDRIYDPSGHYAGTIVGDRVVYRRTQSTGSAGPSSAANRVGVARAVRVGSAIMGDEPPFPD